MVSGAIARSSSPPPNAHEWQFSADVETCAECIYRYGEIPDTVVAERMVQRAKDRTNERAALYWAAYSKIKGWTNDDIDGPAILQKAADMGYEPAARDLGIFMMTGVGGIKENPEAGMRLLRPAADSGDPRALYFMAVAYGRSLGGVEADVDRAIQYAQQSLAGGYRPAADLLAQLYASKGEQAKSEQYFEQAAAFGDVNAMQFLLDPSRSNFAMRDPSSAQLYLIYGTVSQDPQITRMLAASMLARKIGSLPDEPSAMLLLARAARDGDSRAAALLARARLQGLWGIERQTERGRRELVWLADGADLSGTAAFILGQALREGAGLPVDITRGFALIQRSASLQFEPAKKWLADNTSPFASSQSNRGASSTPISSVALKAQLDAAMQSLQGALLEATNPVSEPSHWKIFNLPMSPDEQKQEDLDDFEEWWRLNTIAPSSAAVERIIARARKPEADVSDRICAALAAFGHLTDQVDSPTMVQWLKQAADQGNPTAMAFYGNLMLDGQGYPQDVQKGLSLLKAAYNQGEPVAGAFLGQVYFAGANSGSAGVQNDSIKGISLLKEACNKGIHMAFWPLMGAFYDLRDWEQLGNIVAEGDYRLEPQAGAMRFWLHTGQLPANGGHFHLTDEAGRQLYTRDSIAGNPILSTMAAVLLDAKLPANVNLARRLIRKSAAQNCIEAKVVLASAHITGENGIFPDVDQGVTELEQIISLDPSSTTDTFAKLELKMGRADAEWVLGRMLYEGKYVAVDQQRGRHLIERAAADHQPGAIEWLANQKKQ